MSRDNQVMLRVRAYGQQGVEFVLCGPKSIKSRGTFTWCLIAGFLFSAGGFFSWGTSSISRLFSSLLLAGMATLVFQVSGNVVVEETMLVVPALGVKLSKKRRNGAVRSKFVDLNKISGVAITEAITFSNVVYSLVLMVEEQRDMELPFETFRPRIALLQDIYLETKELLFPSDSDRKMRLPVDVTPVPC